jgi:hypothetical protein
MGFSIRILSDQNDYKTILTYESDPEDIIYGTGEQFTHLNLRGLRLVQYVLNLVFQSLLEKMGLEEDCSH